MAITAKFHKGVLRVDGDHNNNAITVSRSVPGNLLVNSGAVPVTGGTPTILNTSLIDVRGSSGDDTIALDDTNGLLPAAELSGGAGNDSLTGGAGDDVLKGEKDDDTLLGRGGADTLFGGTGNDVLNGGTGDDQVFGGNGDDLMIWNPGDGSDTIEGQAGTDTLLFKGSAGSENIGISANGGRVSFTRDLGNITISLNGVEHIHFNAFAGVDNIVVNDLSGTDVTEMKVDLAASGGSADGQADSVDVSGTGGDDVVTVTSVGLEITVAGLAAEVHITNADAGLDKLIVDGLGGADEIDAGGLAAGRILLGLRGGLGADMLIGGQGDDLINGGDGNDIVDGNQGADTAHLGAGDDQFVWNPGDGSDIVEGEAGTDTLVFNGSAGSENIGISANGGRVSFTRDLGVIAMDLNDVEHIQFNAFAGVDNVVIEDLSGTDVTEVKIDLAASGGGADGQVDRVNVSGTGGDDVVMVDDAGSEITVVGLTAQVVISNADAGLDRLIVNGLVGTDTIDASGLAAGMIVLELRGGVGADVLTGSQGDDLFAWNPGYGSDTIEGQAGTDTLLFNGSAGNENIGISDNGGRVSFTRDLGSIAMDLNDVEHIHFNAFAGVDNIVINDLGGTDVTAVSIDLRVAGAGDGSVDTITLNPGAGETASVIDNGGGSVTILGLAAQVSITGFEAGVDRIFSGTVQIF